MAVRTKAVAEDRLVVDFYQKIDVRKKGAVYIRGSIFEQRQNGWYAPEDKTVEDGVLTQNNPVREELLRLYGRKEVSERKQNEKAWEDTLKKEDTIRIADTLREIGLPPSESQRLRMFKTLRNPRAGLRIDWDALCSFSEPFRERYGEEKVEELVNKHLIGISDFDLGVDNSTMTNEEKEFMHYVFQVA